MVVAPNVYLWTHILLVLGALINPNSRGRVPIANSLLMAAPVLSPPRHPLTVHALKERRTARYLDSSRHSYWTSRAYLSDH